MSEWATMQEEVSRKAFDTLLHANAKHDAGIITDRELWVVCDTLYGVVCGLIPWSDADLILAARDSLKLENMT